MAPRAQPGWWIYKEQMDFLCLGDALWEPAPTNYTRISIGDVGFTRDGQFHLLFSAGSPLGTRRQGIDVPETFEELDIGTPVRKQPRLPDWIGTDTVQELGNSPGASVSATQPVASSANFSLELTGNHGAALVTRHSTEREDSLLDSEFEGYTKRHYESWVTFARKKKYGNNIHPVLVSGFDMTGDFAMVAYSRKGSPLKTGMTINVPVPASTPATPWGTFRATCRPHMNSGPQVRNPVQQEGAGASLPSQSVERDNQCVFIRYYTMRKRMMLFPEVIRAGAGPHDLGPGDNSADGYPELTVYSHSGSTPYHDESRGGPRASAPDDVNHEQDIVVRNTPHGEEYDSWNVIADYVFRNSNATVALMHHQDLAGIRTAGDTSSVPSLLAKHKPRIVVDPNGVGRIAGKVPQQSRERTLETPEAEPHNDSTQGSIPRGRRYLEKSNGSSSYPSHNTTTKDFQRLWDVVKSTDNETKAVRVLAEIVTEKAGRVFVSQFDREDAEYCIDVLGRGIAGNHFKTTVEKQGFFVTLRKLAGTHGRLPDSMVTTKNIKIECGVLANGVLGDVRRGKYMGHLVALKTLRTAESDDVTRIRKQFCKEVVLWSTLSHPHVMKLRGVCGDIDKGQFIAVSEWMANGNIMEYIKENYVNRLELLYGVAQGLKYMHNAGLTHGDLKGANILMSNEKPPRACLADFGFMTMVLDPNKPMACSAQLEGGTVPFVPPELLVPSRFGIVNPVPTPQADVYGFGMVTLQVLTGEIPFRRVRQTELTFYVVQGLRPDKPANAPTIGLSEPLWNFVQRCWDQDRGLRPKVADVVEHLARAAANWYGLMPPCSKVESVGPPVSEEPASDTLKHCRIFAQDSTVDLGSTTDSISLFSHPSLLSTVFSDAPLEPEVTLSKLFVEPLAGSWGALRRRPQDVPDDLDEARHLTYNYHSPPTSIPPPKQKPFRSFKKIREFLLSRFR